MSSKKIKAHRPTVRMTGDHTNEVICLTYGDLQIGSEVCIRTVVNGKVEAVWVRLKTQQAVDEFSLMFPNVVDSSNPA